MTFIARADGSPVRGTRAIVVGDAGVLPPAPAAEAPSPPPANANPNGGASARWLYGPRALAVVRAGRSGPSR